MLVEVLMLREGDAPRGKGTKAMTATDDHGDLLEGFDGPPAAGFPGAPEVAPGLPLHTVLAGDDARPAVTEGDITLTRGELRARADAAAAGLLSAGARRGDRIVLHLPNGIDLLVAVLACLRTGVVPVMTLPGHGVRELAHLAGLAGATTLVSGNAETAEAVRAELEASIPGFRVLADRLPASDIPAAESLPETLPWDAVPQDFRGDVPALLLVSGGTTGLPKLIPRTHDDYLYDIRAASAACGIGAADVYLSVLPTAHNFPLASPGVLGTFLGGGHVVCALDPSPESAFDLIERHGVTVTSIVPSLASVWAAATAWEPADLSTLRLLQVGGSRLAPDAAALVDAAFPGALQQVFGMAEGLLCFTRPGDPDRERVRTTQGYPASPLDELRVGPDGELLVRGPYTIRGYYRAPEHNARAFTPDGFYRSGDRVEIGADGSVVVTGRIKDVVIRAGENVVCDEVEEVLMRVPGVRDVVVIGLPDDHLGESTCAAVVRGPGEAPTLAGLRAAVTAAGLAAFKAPDRMIEIASVPLTVVGKPDRKVLRSRVLAEVRP